MSKTLSLEVSAFLRVCESVDTPRSLACFLLVSSREYKQYFDMPPPFRGLNVGQFRDDYLVTEMLSKNEDIDIGVDKKAAALDKFFQSELKCKITNERILALNRGQIDQPRFLRDVRYWINRILGNLSHEKLKYVEEHARFGPGATSSCVGANVTPSNKYACDAHVTLRLRPLIKALMGPSWLSFPYGDVLVNDRSTVTTVPKNAKTHRTICIEPHMNVFVQLGVGALIRTRLAAFGIDLSTQEWNRYLASVAGAWRLCTVDLTSASDMISHNVVKYLLPRKWYELLFSCRTDVTTVNGEDVVLEKFSSMGNGYTFELETLIFTAVALAAGADRSLMAVYGDDIIVERKCYSKLLEILTFLGFEVNSKKTFIDGDFYESCGSDWFKGVNVRPVYLRGGYQDADQASFQIANAIRRHATFKLTQNFWVSDRRFLPAWIHIVSRASRLAKLTCIPDGVGDDGFVRCQNEQKHHGLTATVLPHTSLRSRRTRRNGAYLAALHRGSGEISRNDEDERGSFVRSKRVRDVQLWYWTGVGPWL